MSKENITGLTLIEVLIALAIISIALTAIIKATAQDIRATAYLQDKTMAMWVGEQAMNEARVGIVVLPFSPAELRQSTILLGKTWYWRAHQEATPNSHIQKMVMDISEHADGDAVPILHIESYLNHEAKT